MHLRPNPLADSALYGISAGNDPVVNCLPVDVATQWHIRQTCFNVISSDHCLGPLLVLGCVLKRLCGRVQAVEVGGRRICIEFHKMWDYVKGIRDEVKLEEDESSCRAYLCP